MNNKRRTIFLSIAAGLAAMSVARTAGAAPKKPHPRKVSTDPEPTPTEPTSAPAPVDSTRLYRKGLNGGSGLASMSSTTLAATVSGYQALGVKWVRFGFDWSKIQPNGPSEYRLSGYEAAVKALVDAGIKVLGILEYTPSWANGGKPTKFYPPLYPSDFGTFAGRMASHFAPLGVHAWEIWNEPNLGNFWSPAPDPAAYVTLLAHACTAIRKANSSAVVVTGGLAQPGTTTTTMKALDFLTAMYKHGARGYFDAVGNHPYDSPRLPSEGYNWQRMFSTTPSMLSIMADNGDAGKRIWVTEIGAPTSGTSQWNTVVSESRQADILAEAYALAATYTWAGPVFWYNYKDYRAYDSNTSSEGYYGVIRYDGSKKPSAAALLAAPN